MAWPWNYAIQVTGLGEVGVLFLPHATTDDDARKDVCAGNRCDPRREVVALYRISCLIDELASKDIPPLQTVRGRQGRFRYILTGSLEKKVRDSVFTAESAFDAIAIARAKKWDAIRLYQCEDIPLA